jgi:hypothetical protein
MTSKKGNEERKEKNIPVTKNSAQTTDKIFILNINIYPHVRVFTVHRNLM